MFSFLSYSLLSSRRKYYYHLQKLNESDHRESAIAHLIRDSNNYSYLVSRYASIS